MFSAFPRRLLVGAGALSPEKGGALRKQSAQGRRLGVAAALCGGVFGVPLLLLQHGSAHALRVAAAVQNVASYGAHHAASAHNEMLSSQLVRFQAESGADTLTSPPGAPLTTTVLPTAIVPMAIVPTAVLPTAVALAPAIAPSVTTTTIAPAARPAVITDSEQGQATWYAAAPPGRCASPTLPFGTVLRVTSITTGAKTTCMVDDREQAGYPRVVDLSPPGFAQLADLGQGVVDVTISW